MINDNIFIKIAAKNKVKQNMSNTTAENSQLLLLSLEKCISCLFSTKLHVFYFALPDRITSRLPALNVRSHSEFRNKMFSGMKLQEKKPIWRCVQPWEEKERLGRLDRRGKGWMENINGEVMWIFAEVMELIERTGGQDVRSYLSGEEEAHEENIQLKGHWW